MQFVRYGALVLLVVFSVFTIYVSRAESFWKSLRIMWALKWGRQVTMDLYVGLFLFSFFIYMNENSLWVFIAWLLPMLIIGNPVTLLYFILNFESLAAHFISR